MRIDSELRRIVKLKVAARNKAVANRRELVRAALDAFCETPKGMRLLRKMRQLYAKYQKHDKISKAFNLQIHEALQPLGLHIATCVNKETKEMDVFLSSYFDDDQRVMKMKAAGIVLPESVAVTEEEILLRCANAKNRKEMNAVLAEYDIHWE